MLVSHYFLPTEKETPADAELASHQLMLRAGLVRKLASGLYTWLPLGLRVLRKIECIVREEMNRSGALEMLMPSIHPAELWQESGRWQQYGPELLRFSDRHQREFCYGPTHEEVITDLARRELKSYKQLPLTLYQIQTKFRDEIRPRFGVMRAREFIMKDAYSFHSDPASMKKTYDNMYQAYCRIFQRLSLRFRAVLADTGSIGGSYSHEFQVLANAGEDFVVYSDEGDYAANLEKAEAAIPEGERPAATKVMEKLATPDVKTIAALKAFNIEASQSVKTLIVRGTEEPMVALILRGDHELNEIKAQNLPEVASPLEFVAESEVIGKLDCGFGSLGPVNLSMPCLVDRDAAHLADFCCGANEPGFHLIGVNWERDVPLGKVVDLRNVVAGDKSPDGKGHLQFARGIEVGHIFQLGTKYSDAMKCQVLSEKGKPVPLMMGCYGLGISRIVAAAIEQNHDERGILWPLALAPFQLVILPMNSHKSSTVDVASKALYQELSALGIEVLLDDRNERAGVMFADMDLLGIPHRLVVSDKGLEQNAYEYKQRSDKDACWVSTTEVIDFIKQKLLVS